MSDGVKVLDTFLKGLKKLAAVAGEVDALQDEVAGREADALAALVAEVRPLLPRLVKPVSVREPWHRGGGEGTTWREPAVLLGQSFQQDREDGGRLTHTGSLLLLTGDGRFVELALEGQWTEAGERVTEARWHVEARERPVDGPFARGHLRTVLTGLLDALREAIVKGRAEREELRRRVELLVEVDAVISRPRAT